MPPKKNKVVKKKALKRKVVKKKAAPKKAAKRKPAAKKAVAGKPREKGKVIGLITHYFPKVNAGVLKLKAPLAVGATIRIKGHTTDFTQNITSMELDHVVISSAKKGQEIGLLVDSRVRQHDVVYKV